MLTTRFLVPNSSTLNILRVQVSVYTSCLLGRQHGTESSNTGFVSCDQWFGRSSRSTRVSTKQRNQGEMRRNGTERRRDSHSPITPQISVMIWDFHFMLKMNWPFECGCSARRVENRQVTLSRRRLTPPLHWMSKRHGSTFLYQSY